MVLAIPTESNAPARPRCNDGSRLIGSGEAWQCALRERIRKRWSGAVAAMGCRNRYRNDSRGNGVILLAADAAVAPTAAAAARLEGIGLDAGPLMRFSVELPGCEEPGCGEKS